MTSPKFKLRNYWFLWVSTFMRYNERLSVNTTDRCARWKNRNLPNFVTKKPFGNYFRKYRTQFVWLYIFQNILCCFNFHLREAFKSPKNALDTLASWMKTETNTMTFLILNSFMILPLYVNVVTIISKDLNPIFYLFIFSKFNPLNQYYRNYQFLPFFNGENPLLVHGFH